MAISNEPTMTIKTYSTYDNQYLLATNCKIMSLIFNHFHVHSNLPDITHVATKVHMILRRFAVLT